MSVEVIDLGFCEYQKALKVQEEYQQKISDKNHQEVLIFVEHNPVYTLGKNANDSNILDVYPNDVDVHNIDRGGDVTYHGPGQLVGYPILNIKNRSISIGRYVHTLENILIDLLNEYGIVARIREKLIGVWVDDKKIAAIGVRVINGITKHGFALNVNPDLSYFNGIVPCGIEDCEVTSMEQLLDQKVDLKEIQKKLFRIFNNYFI